MAELKFDRDHADLLNQSGMNGIAHVAKELRDRSYEAYQLSKHFDPIFVSKQLKAMSNELARQARLLDVNRAIVTETRKVIDEDTAGQVSDGEHGLLNHLYPEFGGWKKQLSTANCGCEITRYTGIDWNGQLDDKVVEVRTDSMGSELVS
jgi:hypothetical protein